MLIFRKIAKWLIILGTVSLIYGGRVFIGGSSDFEYFVPIRGELIFFLAIICSSLYFVWGRNLQRLKLRKQILLALVGYLCMVFLASVASLFRYDLWFDTYGCVLAVKLLLNIIIFILIYDYVRNDRGFCKGLCLALYIPPLFLIPFLFSTDLVAAFVRLVQDVPMLMTRQGATMMLSPGDRFAGFTLNPIHMGLTNLVAFSFVFFLALYNSYKKNWGRSLIYLFLAAGMCGLNFWSLSRSVIVAMFSVVLAANVVATVYFKKSVLNFFISSVLSGLFIIFVFFVQPRHIKTGLFGRLTPSQLYSFQTETSGSGGRISGPRLDIWRYYIGLIPENPFGLGLNYEQKFCLISENGERKGTHSFFLENWAVGGVGALSFIFYILWKAFLTARNKIGNRDDPLLVWLLGTVIALFGLFVAGIYSGLIFFIQFWILLAIALGYPHRVNKVVIV